MPSLRAPALLLVLILISSDGFSATNFVAKSAPETTPAIATPTRELEVGEGLHYDVYWMGVRVGLGTLEVKEKIRIEGREAVHVVATAETNEFLSKIYPVRDEVHSFIDSETGESLEFRKTLREGRYRADERVRYDARVKKGYYESFHNGSKKEIDIPGPVHDILSVFYWFRRQPLRVGESLHAVVNSEEKNWDMELCVLGQEVKELRGMGSLWTFVVEPKTKLKGILYKRGRAWVHYTCDQKRVPVLVTLKTPFGPVIGVLKSGA